MPSKLKRQNENPSDRMMGYSQPGTDIDMSCPSEGGYMSRCGTAVMDAEAPAASQERDKTVGETKWYALWVKSRHEFVTERELDRKGIETFLPTVSKVRQWKDRKKLVDFPLFPGYLFVRVTPRADEFLNVVTTQGSVTLVALEPGH